MSQQKPKGRIVDVLPASMKKKVKKQILKDLTFEDLNTIGGMLAKFYEADRVSFAKKACQLCKGYR